MLNEARQVPCGTFVVEPAGLCNNESKVPVRPSQTQTAKPDW